MPSLITPRELTKWVPGKVLSASDALGWKDVGQRTYRYVGQDVAVPGIDHFTIVRYCVGATRMERRLSMSSRSPNNGVEIVARTASGSAS